MQSLIPCTLPEGLYNRRINSHVQVGIKPSNLHGNLQKYAQISSNEGVFIVEVPTVWILDQCQWGKPTAGQETSLGAVEVVYLRKIDLVALQEGRYVTSPNKR